MSCQVRISYLNILEASLSVYYIVCIKVAFMILFYTQHDHGYRLQPKKKPQDVAIENILLSTGKEGLSNYDDFLLQQWSSSTP